MRYSQYALTYWYLLVGKEEKIKLRLDLGLRLLIFAWRTNLESGPRFAEILWTVKILLTKKSPVF